jgi:hypothetical protein
MLLLLEKAEYKKKTRKIKGTEQAKRVELQ